MPTAFASDNRRFHGTLRRDVTAVVRAAVFVWLILAGAALAEWQFPEDSSAGVSPEAADHHGDALSAPQRERIVAA